MYLSNNPVPATQVYKYCSWNRDLSWRENFGAVITKKIRYSKIRRLNDEFDTRLVFKSGSTIDGDFTLKLIDWVNATRLIASFTTNSTSQIMWAHYSSKNEGYLIEYGDLPVHKVAYSTFPVVFIDKDRTTERIRHYLERNGHSHTDKEAMMNHMLGFFQTDHLILESSSRACLTKHIDWSYENEVRMFCDIKSNRQFLTGRARFHGSRACQSPD